MNALMFYFTVALILAIMALGSFLFFILVRWSVGVGQRLARSVNSD